MDYRTIPGDKERVSTIGIGGSHLHELSVSQIRELLEYAVETGINVIDLAVSYEEPIKMVGEALDGLRDKFVIQLHFGLTFNDDGQYVRTRNLEAVKEGFEKQLSQLNTDYADIGFIHYVDELEDFEEVMASGVFKYAKEMRANGTIKQLGFASHNIDICNKFLETGDMDMCLFSINTAYDLDPVGNIPFDDYKSEGQNQLDASKDRIAFYKECEKRGIGIQVMKAYGGGTLLDPKTSPFGEAMTIHQCLKYALDRPAVLSCLLGVSSLDELKETVGYYSTPENEKDYTFISTLQHKSMNGMCVYCNHCLPCPADIDIAAVHKYLDLYEAGDQLAKEHYLSLSRKASECIQCGSCERECPFSVQIIKKMEHAVEVLEV